MSLPTHTANTLLNRLSAQDAALLWPHLSRRDIRRQDVLVRANVAIDHVYFLEGGVASIVAPATSTRPTEVGLFGREGLSATALLLGSDRSPHETFIQVGDATALRIDAPAYLAAVGASETLRATLLRFMHVMLVQSAQSTATLANQRIEARLARWLLMCHDRVDGDEIAITHELIGTMIAAERSGVTLALHLLEGEGMIRSTRGRVTIRDRRELERLAAGGYGIPEAEYRRLLGPFGRTPAAASAGT